MPGRRERHSHDYLSNVWKAYVHVHVYAPPLGYVKVKCWYDNLSSQHFSGCKNVITLLQYRYVIFKGYQFGHFPYYTPDLFRRFFVLKMKLALPSRFQNTLNNEWPTYIFLFKLLTKIANNPFWFSWRFLLGVEMGLSSTFTRTDCGPYLLWPGIKYELVSYCLRWAEGCSQVTVFPEDSTREGQSLFALSGHYMCRHDLWQWAW